MTIPETEPRPMRGAGSYGQSARKAIHMPEVVWQRQVQQLAQTLGWVDWHHLRSIGTRAGVADLELLHARKRLHVRAELKAETGVMTAAQVAMFDLLKQVHRTGLTLPGVLLFVWRPSDLEHATGVLQGNRAYMLGPTCWEACRPAEVDNLGPKELRRLAELHTEYGLVPR